jgi:sugar lactone lactonase YvrE
MLNMPLYEERVLIDNLMYPEGPRWHDGNFFVADFYACEIQVTDLDGRHDTLIEVPNQPSGMGWLGDGRMFVVSMLDARLLEIVGDELIEVADMSSYSDHLNDMVIDSRGRAYIGGMPALYGDNTEIVDGRNPGIPSDKRENIYLVDLRGGDPGDVRIAAPDIDFPNGTVVTPDGKTLIMAESRAHRLIAFDIVDDGTLINKRKWADLGGRTPDGICLDADNHVWCAVPFPPSVAGFYRVAEGGEIKEWITSDRAAMACAFGGPDRDHLLLVEATIIGTGAAAELRTRGNGRARVGRVDVPGAGIP